MRAVIHLLLLTAAGFLYHPALGDEVLQVKIQQQCSQFKIAPSSPLTAELQDAVTDCQTQFKNFLCEPLARKYPAIRDHLRKCDAASICDGDGSPLLGLYGGVKGLAQNGVDSVKAMADIAWKSAIDAHQTFEIGGKCDQILACKRSFIEEIPWRKGQTDQDLAQVSSIRLASEAMVASGLQKLNSLGSQAVQCAEHPLQAATAASSAIKTEAESKFAALSDWSSEQAILTTLRYYCVDREGQGEVVGYTTGYFADPLAAAGALAKSRYLSSAAALAKDPETAARVTALNADHLDNIAAAEKPALSGSEAATREKFISSNLNDVFSSPEQNEKFIALEERPTDGKTLFVQSENSAMKTLNDDTRDKNFVTSLTNQRKAIERSKFSELKARNPGLEISNYSDFKTEKYALSGKIPKDIEQQLQKLWSEANSEYASTLKKAGVLRPQDHPETWFRAGASENSDVANLYTRDARNQGEANRLMSEDSDPALSQRMQNKFQNVEDLRKQAAASLGAGSPLLENSASGKPVITRETLDLVRKSPNADVLQAAVQAHYGLPGFSPEQSKALLNYAHAADEFQPSIRIAKREIVNLDGADHGGFTADFLGLGSANHHSVGTQLADSKDFRQAVSQTRVGEKSVTAEFKARMKRFQDIAGDFVKCSGDDCAGVASSPLTHVQKETMLSRLAADDRTRGVRVAFIPEGVGVTSDRTKIATHGESIEKFLRKKLRGQVPTEKLKGTLFAMDMKSTKINQGAVELMAATAPGVKWTSKEWAKIQEAFDYAVHAHNEDLIKGGTESAYRAVKAPCEMAAMATSCLSLQEASP